jgi:hypothetical protein
MMDNRISRRTVLHGLGASVALPLLEAMLPAVVRGAVTTKLPRRMAFLYVPNGVHMQDWKPAAEGADYEMPWILEPLKPFKNDMLVLTGLTQDKARPNGDGPGDHARSLASFLTGCQAKKTHGADIRVGISVDQLAAEKVGAQTKFASLELGCDRGQQAGNCDSGYSCAYSSNISWRGESTPVAKEINPRLVFERLFGSAGGTGAAKKTKYDRSVLDYVLEDARQLKNRLGDRDQRKLDEYLTSVREIEQRIAKLETESVRQDPSLNFTKPTGVPTDYAEHIRAMEDLMVLAFQGDITRISTMVIANEGSNRSYPFIDVPEGHHDLSHHGRYPKKQAKIREINRFHITNFAYFIEKLKSIPEGDGTLLDNCMIVYGSGISDGNRHNHNDLPVLLVGKGGGTYKTGQHLKYADNTPLNNLYLSMLDRIDAEAEKLGDSTGRLELPT